MRGVAFNARPPKPVSPCNMELDYTNTLVYGVVPKILDHYAARKQGELYGVW